MRHRPRGWYGAWRRTHDWIQREYQHRMTVRAGGARQPFNPHVWWWWVRERCCICRTWMVEAVAVNIADSPVERFCPHCGHGTWIEPDDDFAPEDPVDLRARWQRLRAIDSGQVDLVQPSRWTRRRREKAATG